MSKRSIGEIIDAAGLHPDFLSRDFWVHSISGKGSKTYDMTELDLYREEDLSKIRAHNQIIKKKIAKLSDHEKGVLRTHVWATLSHEAAFFWINEEKWVESTHRNGSSPARIKHVTEKIVDSKAKKICELGVNCGAWTSLHNIYFKHVLPEDYVVCDLVPEFSHLHLSLGVDSYICNLAREKTSEIIAEKFDLIIITEVIEHLADGGEGIRLIQDALSMLNPMGSILVSYPKNVSNIVSMDSHPLGHHYQPKEQWINAEFSDMFEETEMSNDGSRLYHFFRKLK